MMTQSCFLSCFLFFRSFLLCRFPCLFLIFLCSCSSLVFCLLFPSLFSFLLLICRSLSFFLSLSFLSVFACVVLSSISLFPCYLLILPFSFLFVSSLDSSLSFSLFLLFSVLLLLPLFSLLFLSRFLSSPAPTNQARDAVREGITQVKKAKKQHEAMTKQTPNEKRKRKAEEEERGRRIISYFSSPLFRLLVFLVRVSIHLLLSKSCRDLQEAR